MTKKIVFKKEAVWHKANSVYKNFKNLYEIAKLNKKK